MADDNVTDVVVAAAAFIAHFISHVPPSFFFFDDLDAVTYKILRLLTLSISRSISISY